MNSTWQVIVLILAAGVIVEGVFVVALMRQVGELMLNGTPTGPRRSFGPRLGVQLNLPGRVDEERPALVVFTSPGCQQCKVVAPFLAGVHAAYGPGCRFRHQLDLIAIVTDQDPIIRQQYVDDLGTFARADLVELMQDWDVPGTPFVVALDANNIVRASELVNSQMQLEMIAVERLGATFVAPEHRDDQPATLQISQADSNHSDSHTVLQ